MNNTATFDDKAQKLWAEKWNGRIAMLGLIAAATSDLLTGHMFFGLFQVEFATDSFPYWKAIVWCLYPMSVLVCLELFARFVNDNDDDDDQGGGLMQPVYNPI